jgi:hypothetical protein
LAGHHIKVALAKHLLQLLHTDERLLRKLLPPREDAPRFGVLHDSTTSVSKVIILRSPSPGGSPTPQRGSWLLSIWIELADMQWNFSIKTFL